jgi:PAS domain S-box-containing protein
MSERKKAEERIREAVSEWQRTFDSIVDLLFMIDNDSRFVKVNKAFCDFLKAKPEGLLGKKCYEVLHKRDNPWPDCPFQKLLKDGKTHTEEIDDPNIGVSLLVTVSPLFDEKQKMIGAVHIAKDITERKNMEKMLRESEQKARAIFDQTFQFIGLMTPDGTLIEANRTALEFSGIEASSVLNKPFWETPWWTHSPELQEKLRQAIKRVAQGEFVRFEATHTAKDGTLHSIDFSLKPVKDASGKVIFMIPEGRDITERKQEELELKNTYDKLSETQAQLIQSAKMAAIGLLASGVAHEINNPLSVISGETQMLLKDRDKEIRETSKTILEQVKRIENIVQRLSEFSRWKKPEFTPLDLNKIMEESIFLLKYQTKVENIEIVNELTTDLPKPAGDKTQIQEVFLNIMLNAVEAMERGGILTIRTYSEKITEIEARKTDKFKIGENVAVVEIKDTGKGIDDVGLDKLFEPFFTTKEEGVGLGLSICYGIIEKHGGVIEVQSKLGEGSTFIVKLPIP